MTRKAVYLKAMESFDEPATLMDIQFQAAMLFGDAVRPSIQSVRSSIERFVMLGRVKKLTGDGETRYWLIDKPIDARVYIEHRILMLRAEIRELERQLAIYCGDEENSY